MRPVFTTYRVSAQQSGLTKPKQKPTNQLKEKRKKRKNKPKIEPPQNIKAGNEQYNIYIKMVRLLHNDPKIETTQISSN